MGRFPTALWLTMCTALGACTGPISDFPSSSAGGRGGNDSMHPAPVSDGGTRPPTLTLDAGTISSPPESIEADAGLGTGGLGPIFGGADGGALNPDADLPDGGADLSDGGDDAGEGGIATDGGCQASTDLRDAGGCYGALCGTTLPALTLATTRGACNDVTALGLACDGQISRSAAQCAQSSTTSLWFDNALRTCLRSEPSLDSVPPACLDCYADELLCTLSNCLVACVSDLELECSGCRQQHCAAAFVACSGISGP